ncbi:hypothetical protein L1049_021477 [Liquidambar formosana]|uniref:Uncharacterized protein n=1 Tax=Liquidambar formosana TaxID=63359 RepID=A0AAP0QXE3_LIQFO
MGTQSREAAKIRGCRLRGWGQFTQKKGQSVGVGPWGHNHVKLQRYGHICRDVDIVKNHQVQFLKLAWNPSLRDESLKRIVLSCPNLQFLDLSHCVGITHEGLGEIFKNCKKLRHLKLYAYSDSKIFGSDSELYELNLEVLNAPDYDIDDEGMAMMAERCRGLLRLNLTNCGKVTEKGVKEFMDGVEASLVTLRNEFHQRPVAVTAREALKLLLHTFHVSGFL